MKSHRVIAFCLLLSPLGAVPQQPASRQWNFESDKLGELPAGFSNETGEWKIVPRSDGRGNALAQRARNARPVFNVALVRDTSYADVDASVELKAEAGEIDQGGGLVWRAADGSNYYIARYNPLENNFRLYKVVGGARTQLATADVPGDKNWHTLRVTMAGANIECFLDGRRFLTASDGTFPGAGKIGTWTKADAQTLFDSLSVKRFNAN